MASASALNCSKVLVNGNFSLTESNLTNLDFIWNLLFANCFIFETKAVGTNMVIHNIVWGYFNKIDLIYSNFCELGIHCYRQYDLYGLITLQCIMFLLLLPYCFIFISSKTNSYFCVILIICYNYGSVYNVLSNNINNTMNKYYLLNE